MIKLIAIDLDGSLLTDDKRLPPDFFQIAGELQRRGILLTIASGRPLSNIRSVFEPIKEQIYFASDNGSYLVFQDQELIVNSLDHAALVKFIGISRQIPETYPVLCGKNIAYVEHLDEVFQQQALKYYQEYVVVKDLATVQDEILKVSLCDLIGSEVNSYPFYKAFENEYQVVVSGQLWLDITNKDASKATAIRKIQQQTGIRPEETLVFGDYLNDTDMIREAAYSYAMKNAHPQILQLAKFVTNLDNNHYGVTETIKQLLDIQL
ncbi:HAD family hydrolase [Niabella terrae]